MRIRQYRFIGLLVGAISVVMGVGLTPVWAQSDTQFSASPQIQTNSTTSFDTQVQLDRYIRKSISTTNTIWINQSVKSQNLPMSIDVISQLLMKAITKALNLNRFDTNALPDRVLLDFQDELNQQTNLNSGELSIIVNKTIAASIMEILNDPEIQRERADSLKNTSSVLTFAETKGKSNSLTLDELSVLFNSAFIYLPMITSIKVQNLGETIRVTLEGSILWYQVLSTDTGQYQVALLDSIDTAGIGYSDKHTILPKARLNEAVTQAILTLAQNLAIKTRELNVFRLRGKITDVQGLTYKTAIGEKEGIQLNDYFKLYEYEEKNGLVQPVYKGYLRVGKVGDTLSSANARSTLYQEIGLPQSPGSFIIEHPKNGMSVKLFGSSKSLQLSKQDFAIKTAQGQYPIFADDVTQGSGLSIGLTKDLSASVHIPNVYFDIWAGYVLPTVDWSNSNPGGAYLLNLYFGFSKKYSIQRHGIRIGAGVGMDRLEVFGAEVTTERGNEDVSLTLDTLGFSASVDYELRLSTNWIGFAGVNYAFSKLITKQTLSPDRSSEIQLNQSNLGGADIRFGVTYEFTTLKFDPLNVLPVLY